MATEQHQPMASVLARSDSVVTTGSNGLYASDRSTVAADSEDTPLLLDSGSTSATLRSASPIDDDDGATAHHHVAPVRAVCISLSTWVLLFMQACNMSGMAMVQGHIAEDLGAYEDAMWFTSVYLIVMASTAPLAGRLATIFSLRAMVLSAALFFALGAIVTSRAMSFAVFILGRVLTGVGGGFIMTLSMILVLQLTSRKRRGLFVGIVNAGFTAGVATGAIVFGALLPVLGWRALFLVQAPAGLLAGVCVYSSIPAFAAPDAPSCKYSRSTLVQKLRTIDYAGAATLTAAIVLFLYGLSGTIQPLPLLLSLLALAAFLLTEYKLAADPLIPVSVLQSRGVLLSCAAQLGLMAARWTVLFYAPVFVLAVRGLSPTVAGAVLVPTNLGFAAGGMAVGWLHIRRAGAFWLPCVASVLLFGLSLLGLALTSTTAATSPAWLYVLVVFANGLCAGAAVNYTLAHLLHVAAPETHYVATGLLSTFRGFAGSFGSAIGGGIFARELRRRLTAGFEALDGTGTALSPARARLVTRLVGGPNLVFGGLLDDDERAIAVAGYEGALKVLYMSAVVLTVFVLFMQAGTGWTAPVGHQVDDEEIREELLEHDGRMEA